VSFLREGVTRAVAGGDGGDPQSRLAGRRPGEQDARRERSFPMPRRLIALAAFVRNSLPAPARPRARLPLGAGFAARGVVEGWKAMRCLGLAVLLAMGLVGTAAATQPGPRICVDNATSNPIRARVSHTDLDRVQVVSAWTTLARRGERICHVLPRSQRMVLEVEGGGPRWVPFCGQTALGAEANFSFRFVVDGTPLTPHCARHGL
jgi:hypothetical protein